MNEYLFKNELKRDWLLLVILVGALLGSLAIYPHLPDRVPIHWNVAGQVDNYGSRAFGAFFGPVMAMVVFMGMLALPLIDPRRENYDLFRSSYRIVRWAVVLFLLVIWVVANLVALGHPVDVGMIVTLSVGVLFIVFGNHMGQLRHNYFVGIRNPWTLANEVVWRHTHRVGGRLFVLAGLIIMATSLVNGSLAFYILIAVIAILVFGLTIYSYLISRRTA